MTLGEVVRPDAGSARYADVRWCAREVTKSWPKRCKICGYSKHVENCHVKAIQLFDESTPLSVINSENNLVLLCPNHHWEFDNLHIEVVPGPTRD